MTHMYSNQLVAYLFNEIEPDLKRSIEAAFLTDKGLLAEFNELKAGLKTLESDKPFSPDDRVIENIIRETTQEELIH